MTRKIMNEAARHLRLLGPFTLLWALWRWHVPSRGER